MLDFTKGNAETDERNLGAVVEGFKMVREHENEIQRMLRDGGVGSDVWIVRNEEKYFPNQLEVPGVSMEELLELLLGHFSDVMMQHSNDSDCEKPVCGYHPTEEQLAAEKEQVGHSLNQENKAGLRSRKRKRVMGMKFMHIAKKSVNH